jgi:hypothetical protein
LPVAASLLVGARDFDRSCPSRSPLPPPLPWLCIRVIFVANPFDGARPSIDTLVVPVD